MTFDRTTLVIILVMTVAAALCRLAGYGFMRFVPLTPRVEAGLKAVPLAVMIGIMGPPVLKGGMPEIVGLVATIAAVRLGLNDLIALVAGMGMVAALRAVI
jgi:uncharacterized membrane protein